MVKKGSKKRGSGKVSKSSQKKPTKSKNLGSTKNKVRIIVRNLILFGALFLLSAILYRLSGSNEILSNFFWILALVMGGVTAAFVISYLVFYFMKSPKK